MSTVAESREDTHDAIKKYLQEFTDPTEIKTDEQTELEQAVGEDNDEAGTFFVDEDGQLYFQPAENAESEALASETKPLRSTPSPETIIPDRAEEEISYIYIVEEEEEQNESKEENDLTVYDFDEDNDENVRVDDDVDYVQRKPKTKKANKIHFCPHCEYSTPKRAALKIHLKDHSDDRPYKCFICSRGFRTNTSLTNHENTHTGNKPFRCRLCDARFTTSGEIVRHVRYRHSNYRPHKCNECNYAAVELSKLRRHQRSHTGERPYQCPHCTYASPDTFKLKRHIRVHTGERPYKCDICSAAFSQSNSLKTHRLTHFPEQRPAYQCALCPVTCGRKADLRGHISKLHTAYRPYECKRCGKHLPDRYTYKTHIRTHVGERSYKCTVCSYSSVSKLHLESHMYIHTNEKPYQCDQCDYRSRQKQLLKRHKNYYHTPGFVPPESQVGSHECEVCRKKFIHIGNLIKHFAIHDPDSNVHAEKELLSLGRKQRIKDEPSQEGAEGMTTVKVVDDFDEEDEHYVIFEMVEEEGEEGEEAEEPTEVTEKTLPKSDMKSVQKVAKPNVKENMDMDNCFGFDEDEDEDKDEEEYDGNENEKYNAMDT